MLAPATVSAWMESATRLRCSLVEEMSLFPSCFTSVPVIPYLFGTRDWFRGRQFFHGLRRGDGFRMIQTHSIWWVLYFCYYYISSTSNHQAFQIPEVGDPCSIQYPFHFSVLCNPPFLFHQARSREPSTAWLPCCFNWRYPESEHPSCFQKTYYV